MCTRNTSRGWAWWLSFVISALLRLRKKECYKFKGSLGYRERPCLNNINKGRKKVEVKRKLKRETKDHCQICAQHVWFR